MKIPKHTFHQQLLYLQIFFVQPADKFSSVNGSLPNILVIALNVVASASGVETVLPLCVAKSTNSSDAIII